MNWTEPPAALVAAAFRATAFVLLALALTGCGNGPDEQSSTSGAQEEDVLVQSNWVSSIEAIPDDSDPEVRLLVFELEEQNGAPVGNAQVTVFLFGPMSDEPVHMQTMNELSPGYYVLLVPIVPGVELTYKLAAVKGQEFYQVEKSFVFEN